MTVQLIIIGVVVILNFLLTIFLTWISWNVAQRVVKTNTMVNDVFEKKNKNNLIRAGRAKL